MIRDHKFRSEAVEDERVEMFRGIPHHFIAFDGPGDSEGMEEIMLDSVTQQIFMLNIVGYKIRPCKEVEHAGAENIGSNRSRNLAGPELFGQLSAKDLRAVFTVPEDDKRVEGFDTVVPLITVKPECRIFTEGVHIFRLGFDLDDQGDLTVNHFQNSFEKHLLLLQLQYPELLLFSDHRVLHIENPGSVFLRLQLQLQL